MRIVKVEVERFPLSARENPFETFTAVFVFLGYYISLWRWQ